ncbi:MAG TPA: hypothetical protein VGN72_07255 [Tepidisphaeraceae bacterium]|jgi:hypothetical protein|nr:hypothetical protein [Tepidisphaeraceae bacterium]
MKTYNKWVLSGVAMMASVAMCTPSAMAQNQPVAPPAYNLPDTPGFPQTLAGQIPEASSQRARSRMVLLRTKSDMAGTFRKMRFMFDRSPEFRAIAAEERTAYEEYESARLAALAKLVDNEDYKAVVKLRDELGEQIIQLQSVKDIPASSIVPLAEEKLNYARTASAMEAQALAEDPAVRQARDQFVAAGSKLADTKLAFDDSMRYHPDIEAARVKVEDARIEKVADAAYSRALNRVTAAALDYAYFINRSNRPTVGYPASYPGYGDDYGYNDYYGYGYRR